MQDKIDGLIFLLSGELLTRKESFEVLRSALKLIEEEKIK